MLFFIIILLISTICKNARLLCLINQLFCRFGLKSAMQAKEFALAAAIVGVGKLLKDNFTVFLFIVLTILSPVCERHIAGAQELGVESERCL